MVAWEELETAFRALCDREERRGVLAATPVAGVRLLPEQAAYLDRRLAALGPRREEAVAVSLGMAYRPEEIEPIPPAWVGRKPAGSRWNDYARAYQDLNDCLNRTSRALAERFGGVAEGATIEGLAAGLTHVTEYYPRCVSHRAFAEAAGLGWRGRHGLVVTPEFGPALRLATLFLPGPLEAPRRAPGGCGTCRACLDECPVLDRWGQTENLDLYREGCRLRIRALALEANVCGICVRRCHDSVARAG